MPGDVKVLVVDDLVTSTCLAEYLPRKIHVIVAETAEADVA